MSDTVALNNAGTAPQTTEMIAHMRQQTDASSMNDTCASLMLMAIASRKTDPNIASERVTLNM
jgi:hypothetical protein